MTIQEAIQVRHSVRQYKDTAIEAEKIAQLQALIDECNREAGVHIQLVTNEPNAFSGGLAKDLIRNSYEIVKAKYTKKK